MQRFFSVVLLLLLAVGSTACSSRNPASSSDGGTGYGDRKSGGGSNPSPGTGGGGDGSQPTPAPTGRHTLSWDGLILRLRLAAATFSAWKDGGGEVNVDITTWSVQYIPFNATDSRKNGIGMKREGNDLFGFGAVSADNFNIKYKSPDGTVAWHKYETTELSGVSLESDQQGSSSRHFKIPAPGII